MRLIDLTGQRFGRLVVQCRNGTKHNSPAWDCACDCGGHINTIGKSLRNGETQSCGCLHRERLVAAATTHGAAVDGRSGRTLTYNSWRSMKDRCTQATHKDWLLYGGRGVKVDDRWLGPAGFAHFVADMGQRPAGLTLDRIDPDGGYRPGNCRWATPLEQSNNRRNVRAHLAAL